MIRKTPLPRGIEERIRALGEALARCPGVVFAYVFGGVAKGEIKPLSDVDLAVFLDESVDPIEARLEVLGVATAHLGTDEVDLVILNTASTALVGRIQTRRVICDREPFRRHRFESLALRQFSDFRVVEHRLLARRYAGGDLLLRKLADLDLYLSQVLSQVSEYRAVDVEQYRRDWKTQRYCRADAADGHRSLCGCRHARHR